ncbi:UNVERIFIED_CONTAM: hypothetical protein HDU68_012913 [Siphonaria sp. JEL0065]|nr:hypothetical protein HDU68_012913 [Siphonaria sp. JEL0065]
MAYALTAVELHRALSDLIDMRSEMLKRTDALILQLSGSSTDPNSTPSSHHLSMQFPAQQINELASLTAINQQVYFQKLQQPQQSDVDVSDSQKDSHLDLGVRWDEADYVANIEANKSMAPSVFRDKAQLQRTGTNASRATFTKVPNGNGGVRRNSIFSIMNSNSHLEQPVPMLRKPETREERDSRLSLQASNGKLQLPGRTPTKLSRSSSRARTPVTLSRSRTVAANAVSAQPPKTQASLRSSVGVRPASSVVIPSTPLPNQEKRFSIGDSKNNIGPTRKSVGGSKDISVDSLSAPIKEDEDPSPQHSRQETSIVRETLESATKPVMKLKPHFRQLQTIGSKDTLETSSNNMVVGTATRGPDATSGVSISRIPLKDADGSPLKEISEHQIAIDKATTTEETNDSEQYTQYDRILFYFLVPAFDNKGRILTLDQFDQSDFDDISFSENGLHPKSCFSTIWDFAMSIFYGVVLWIVPLAVGFDEEFSTIFLLNAFTT